MNSAAESTIKRDLVKLYFGSTQAASSYELPKPNRDLTASAKFVIREAKKLISQKKVFENNHIPSEEELLKLITYVEECEGETLSDSERTSVVAALHASLDHYDILSDLVSNPQVNDIIVKSFDDISVQINRKNIQTDLHFPDRESYKSFIENLLKRAGKSCTTATPVVDAAIDGNVRACVTHESFSPQGSGPMLTLRISRQKDISLTSLVKSELAPEIILTYLSSLIRGGKASFLIAGEVGTGKTTLVKALAHCIPEEEAILIIEDTHEIQLQRKFVRTLLTREANTEGSGRISPAMAIRTGMRMAMNRLILGEMRDAEAAEAFIDVCSSGHSGLSTIHARSAKDAIYRLELFLARAQSGVDIQTIRKQIANSVSLVIYLDVDKTNYKRRIKEIVEIGAYADSAIQFSPMFSYVENAELPQWKKDSGISNFGEQLNGDNIKMPFVGENITFDFTNLYQNATQDIIR